MDGGHQCVDVVVVGEVGRVLDGEVWHRAGPSDGFRANGPGEASLRTPIVYNM